MKACMLLLMTITDIRSELRNYEWKRKRNYIYICLYGKYNELKLSARTYAYTYAFLTPQLIIIKIYDGNIIYNNLCHPPSNRHIAETNEYMNVDRKRAKPLVYE